MNEITETIQESAGQAGKSRINALVALFVAITATFMAICNVKDGNIVQAMEQAQAHSLDSWSYYQAKSTKQATIESVLELARLQRVAGVDTVIHRYEVQIARYDKEKAEIKKQAEDFQKQYDDLNLFDDQFDMTEALLTISIAMFGIASLTQRKWLLWFASGMSLLGIVLGLAAFMNVSLHSNFVSKILS
jgi:hypothetical protein